MIELNIKKSQTIAYKKSTLWSITLKGSDGKAISGIKPVLKIYKGNKLYKTVNMHNHSHNDSHKTK